MQFTGEVISAVAEINMIGLYKTIIGRLRQQAWVEKSQTPVEMDILVQWLRNNCQNGWGAIGIFLRQLNIY